MFSSLAYNVSNKCTTCLRCDETKLEEWNQVYGLINAWLPMSYNHKYMANFIYFFMFYHTQKRRWPWGNTLIYCWELRLWPNMIMQWEHETRMKVEPPCQRRCESLNLMYKYSFVSNNFQDLYLLCFVWCSSLLVMLHY